MNMLFRVRRIGTTSIHNQVREHIVAAILGGSLLPEQKMPSTRELAISLRVSRNTIVQVYERLAADGYLSVRDRAGYFVNCEAKTGWVRPEKKGQQPPARQSVWTRKLKFHPSRQPYIRTPLNSHSYPYPFIYGQTDPSLFPISEWRECSRLALARSEVLEWTGDAIHQDDPTLIEQICSKLLPRRGIIATPDQVLITMGAQNALYLAATLLASSKTTVGIENPGYSDIRNAFIREEARILPIDVDAEGLVIDDRLRDCNLVYLTPSHQYPTNVTLPLHRREALLASAAEHDFLIIEDDYENETNFVTQPIPALKSLDEGNRVLYASSLSKSMFPGLRIGYMVGPADFVAEARALRRQMYRHPPANNQRTTSIFISLGYYDSHIRRLREALRERWGMMKEALAEFIPEASTAATAGGTSFWMQGPTSLDAQKLADAALARGVVIEPGKDLFYGSHEPSNFFRLGVSSIPTDRIRPGIEILGKTLRSI
ncbi:MAG TPA: PLP-dependent aminotransferase family protein [Xanthobacteraceae bacterium]|nr:PLP-dependent aminotransferase family protein [Xanthobacteraceae bacterium]